MTDQLSIITNFEPMIDDNYSVKGIGESKLTVRGKGEVQIKSTVNGYTLKGDIL